MVRNTRNYHIPQLALVAFCLVFAGTFTASAADVEIDYYGGFEGVSANMQTNYSTAYEVAVDEITRMIRVILDREPNPGEVEGWVTGYFAYMVSLLIDVEYVSDEIGRQLFGSLEYEFRLRTDEEFVLDCYAAFLDRVPSGSDLLGWLAGVAGWTRSEAVTVFTASDEYKKRIDRLYTAEFAGLPPENWATRFHLGFTNTLPDEDFLAEWVDQIEMAVGLDALIDASQAMGEALLADLLATSPTNEDVAVALYRACLGRFPNEGEILFYADMLDWNEATPSEVLAMFVESGEFAQMLADHFG